MFNESKFHAELEKQNLTPTKAAKAIGMVPQTFYNKMNGLSQFKINEMSKLKEALKLSPERFCEIFFDDSRGI